MLTKYGKYRILKFANVRYKVGLIDYATFKMSDANV